MQSPGEVPDASEPATASESLATSTESLIGRARDALISALEVAEASFALLRAELRLARSSALALVWLSFALIFFGAGAWLALSALIATAIAKATGSWLLGVGGVAAGNLLGAGWVLLSMRRCWRDLSLPRTRALIVGSRDSQDSNGAGPRPGPQA
ncbi:hypothetical protein [Dokdonella immobilis]|uniref:Holin-X, holin superfamily III n=1 Tax=Dokdonella immobilis TaxID=578942 RepID=A0A1I4YYI0_9GAMM|nr:hypothetical protein [Dokdonella immobilis]SFN43017.1 hypothetical protein SAMN05216289_12121 [Dokdonella immobilis]